jgi:hypothetical protein
MDTVGQAIITRPVLDQTSALVVRSMEHAGRQKHTVELGTVTAELAMRSRGE